MSSIQLVKPTKEQIQWADAEIGVLIHYDIQVFEPSYEWRDQWGYQPDPAIFHPGQLDTDQWIRTAKEAGAKYAILVAKHCSGFSLWPTEAHTYSVKSTPWKNGEGDIVGDFIKSCKKYDILPGLYYSTSANAYYEVDNPGVVASGNPQEQEEYNAMVIQQVRELWTHYGELFEIWFDGGTLPPEKGGPDVTAELKKLQPQAVCFQGPKDFPSLIRWSGNEDGVVEYPCWSTTGFIADENEQFSPHYGKGNPEGELWAPAEADMPNRRLQWFWKENEEHLLIPTEELVDCYYQSVGRNSNLLIGMVIDNRGLVPEADVKQFQDFGQAIKQINARKISEIKGEGDEFVIHLDDPRAINQISIMEEIAEGEKVRSYTVEGFTGESWQKLCSGEVIGHKRIQTFSAVEVMQIKLTIHESVGTPFIRSFSVYEQG